MIQNHKHFISELAQEHGKYVFRCAYRLLSNTQYAEDITQEVFLKLFEKDPSALEQIENWPAFLTTVTVRASIDLIRQHSRKAEQTLSDELQQSGREVSEPLSELLISRDLLRLKNCLFKLNKKDIQIYYLRHIDGYSYQDIASSLSLNASAVGVALHRLQDKLITCIGKSQFLGEQNGN